MPLYEEAVMEERYIQIGVTALRDPVTRDYLPAVPLYIKATEEALTAEQKMITDLGKLFAQQMHKYMEDCNKAGVSV